MNVAVVGGGYAGMAAAVTLAEGGGDGAPGELLIDGKRVDPKSQHFVDPGGTVLIRTPAGGGFGPPANRAPQRVEDDRADGYVN